MKIKKDGKLLEVEDEIIRKRKEILFEESYELQNAIEDFLYDTYKSGDLTSVLAKVSLAEVEAGLNIYLREPLKIYEEAYASPSILTSLEEREEKTETESTSHKGLQTNREETSCILGTFSVDKLPEAIDYIEKYKNSPVDSEEYNNMREIFYVFTIQYVYKEIDKAVHSDPTLNGKMKQQAKDIDDIVNDIYVDALKGISKYSKDKGLLTNFINVYIKKNFHDIYFGNLKQNYAKAAQKCAGVNAIWKEKGYGSPSLLDLHIETRISLKTLSKTLAALRISEAESLESIMEDAGGDHRDFIMDSRSSFYSNPERSFIQKEQAISVKDAIMRLESPYREVFILKNAGLIKDSEFLYNDKDLELIRECDDEEMRKDIIHKLVGVTTEKIDEIYGQALDKIKHDTKFLSSIGKEHVKNEEEEEIAMFDLGVSLSDMDAFMDFEMENDGILQ